MYIRKEAKTCLIKLKDNYGISHEGAVVEGAVTMVEAVAKKGIVTTEEAVAEDINIIH